MIQVPLIEQSLSFNCGPASCRATLLYHGIDVPEWKLIKELQCEPDYGTQTEDMVRVMKEYMPKSYARRRLGFRGLRRALDEGHPVIVLYLEQRGYGHYGVVCHLGDEVTIMNPSGMWEQIEAKSFGERWKDAATIPSYVHWGLVVK